jgi:hypothetical protein
MFLRSQGRGVRGEESAKKSHAVGLYLLGCGLPTTPSGRTADPAAGHGRETVP